MGTSGDANSETHYLEQSDVDFHLAMQAEWDLNESRRRWRIRILSLSICMIAGAVMGLAIWMRR
jgi:hypothetical protein